MSHKSPAYYMAKETSQNISKEISDMEFEARTGRVACLSNAEFQRRVAGNMQVTPPSRDESEPPTRKRSRRSHSASTSNSESEIPVRSEIERLKAKMKYLDLSDDERMTMIINMKIQLDFMKDVAEKLTVRLDSLERANLVSSASNSSVQFISAHNMMLPMLPSQYILGQSSNDSVRSTRSRFDITENENMLNRSSTPSVLLCSSRNVSHRVSAKSRDTSVESRESRYDTESKNRESRSSSPFVSWRNIPSLSHRITMKSSNHGVEKVKSHRRDNDETFTKKAEKSKSTKNLHKPRVNRYPYGLYGCALCGGQHFAHQCDRITNPEKRRRQFLNEKWCINCGLHKRAANVRCRQDRPTCELCGRAHLTVLHRSY